MQIMPKETLSLKSHSDKTYVLNKKFAKVVGTVFWNLFPNVRLQLFHCCIPLIKHFIFMVQSEKSSQCQIQLHGHF